MSSFVKNLKSPKTKKSLQGKVAESQIEKNEAVTKLINAVFDFFLRSDLHSSGTEPIVSYMTGTKYTKDEVLSIMQTMRKDRTIYKTIALYLREKKIPTLSGRGEWHAQTDTQAV